LRQHSPRPPVRSRSVAVRRRFASRFLWANRTTAATREPRKQCIGADAPSGALRRAQRREGFRLGAGRDEIGDAADATLQGCDTHHSWSRPSRCTRTRDRGRSCAGATMRARTALSATVRAAAPRCSSSSATNAKPSGRQALCSYRATGMLELPYPPITSPTCPMRTNQSHFQSDIDCSPQPAPFWRSVCFGTVRCLCPRVRP
jgi:hypothetical protein